MLLQVCYVNQEVVVLSGEVRQLLIAVILAFLLGMGVGGAALLVQEGVVHFDSNERFVTEVHNSKNRIPRRVVARLTITR